MAKIKSQSSWQEFYLKAYFSAAIFCCEKSEASLRRISSQDIKVIKAAFDAICRNISVSGAPLLCRPVKLE
jgi:hypothetical protein